VWRAGNLPLFSASVDGVPTPRPPTILVDSAQLESGEALSADFKDAAAGEIAVFKAEYRRRHPGADAEALTDEDLLREVMNTVGKKSTLGEPVRCVVSVAMLTEGWDANTVTHILGIRAFRSQLLCEQVVGRGLRRRSYAVNDEGRFEAEYANVYGIPFAFIPSDKEIPDTLPKPPAVVVEAVPGREHLRIEFPKVDGYRLEIPDAQLYLDHDAARPFVVGPSTVPTWVESAPLVGTGEREEGSTTPLRRQELAFSVARRLLDDHLARSSDGDRRPWLFPHLVRLVGEWVERHVGVEPGYSFESLRLAEAQATLADHVWESLSSQEGERRPRMRALLRQFDPVGSTGDVSFATRKTVVETTRSEVSHVTLDGKGGNTWEQILALECERPGSRVAAYVKNDHLGFVVPYLYQGRSHSYVPDFLLRLEPRDGDDVVRTLIVEVSGGQKSPGPTHVKAETARNCWCAAVNNHGGFGRWGYLEVTSMADVRAVLAAAIDNLYADAPIVGDPDLLDFAERPGLFSHEDDEERRGA
jgi:type III restriction enzyme